VHHFADHFPTKIFIDGKKYHYYSVSIIDSKTMQSRLQNIFFTDTISFFKKTKKFKSPTSTYTL
jgi:hypothetical protein